MKEVIMQNIKNKIPAFCKIIFILGLLQFVLFNLMAFEPDGTTIKLNADGCTVDFILQIAIVGTVAGIGLALTKNRTMRVIGNDMAVGFGTIATLKLGGVARASLSARKLKKLRQGGLSRGSVSPGSASHGISSAYKATTMSLA